MGRKRLPLPAGEGGGEGHLLPLPAGEGGGEGHLLPLPAGEGGGEGHPLRILRARDLRENSTRAERLLWRRLRDRGLAGVKFRRQHPIGEFVADFCAVEARLVVELDGGQHARQEDERRDAERTRRIEGRGYRVLRFWNLDVLGNVEGVLAVILKEIEPARSPSPCPLPRPRGRGTLSGRGRG